jgi:hypothetical protein
MPLTESFEKSSSFSPVNAMSSSTYLFTTLKLASTTSMSSSTSSSNKETHKTIDECSPNPCANHGTCITFTNGKFYKCFCQANYLGSYCQNGRTWIRIGENFNFIF